MLSAISLLRRGSAPDVLQAALAPPLDDAKRLIAARVYDAQSSFPAVRELCADALTHEPRTATGWHLRLLGSRAISQMSNDPTAQLAAIASARAAGDATLEAAALALEADAVASHQSWEVPLPFQPTWPLLRDLSERAAAAYEAIGDSDGALQMMVLLATYSSGTEDRPRLLAWCEAKAANLEAAGDVVGRAYCLTAAACIRIQESDRAKEAAQKAFAANAAAAAASLSAQLLLEIGQHPQLGDPPQPYLREAARLFATQDHPRGVYSAQFDLGMKELQARRYGNALFAFEAAVAAGDRMGVPPNQMVARQNLAIALLELGHTGQALACLEEASSLPPHSYWTPTLLLQLGMYAAKVHDTDRALRSFTRAVELLEGTDRRRELAVALHGLGQAYSGRRDDDDALANAIEVYMRAAEVEPLVGRFADAATACARLGRQYASQNRECPPWVRETADAAIRRGLALTTRDAERASLHHAASLVEYHLGSRQAAIERIDQAIAAAASLPAGERAGPYLTSAFQRVEYGSMRGDLEMLQRADADADAALEAVSGARKTDLALVGGVYHDSAWASAFLAVLAPTQEARQAALEKAQQRIRQSLELYERANVRLGWGTPASTLGPQLGQHRAAAIPYELAIRLFAMHGDTIEAFEALERLKATVLASALATVRLPPLPGVSPELFENEERLLEVRRSHDDPRELAGAEARLRELWDEIARTPGGESYARLRRGVTVDWRETSLLMLDVERELEAGRRFVIIEYALLSVSPLDETTIMAFCLQTGAPGPEIVRVKIDVREVEAAVAELQPEGIHTAGAAQRLASLEALLEPVRTFTRPGDLLCIVPSRALFSLPIHAIPIDGEPLLARNPLFYAPSVTMLATALHLRRPQARTATALGNPTEDLAGAEQEATDVASALAGTLRLRDEATSAAFLEALRTSDIVHYAGHAAFDSEQPLQSGLALSDGVLTAEQLFAAGEARAMLVVLSGCETGLNRVRSGDEIVGLTRAFLYAGVPALITSLWQVYDATTSRLMTRFYECWLDESMPRVDALRTAALELRASNPESIAAWAPFVLLGDWR